MKKQLRRRILELLPIAGIGLMLLFFIFMGTEDYGALKDRVIRMDAHWRLNGEAVESLPPADRRSPGDITRLETVLDGGFNDHTAMCFYSAYQDVDVFLDGENIYGFHKPEKEKVTKAAPSVWNTVYLPE